MWSVSVIPTLEPNNLALEGATEQRHDGQQSRAFVLQSFDGALDDGRAISRPERDGTPDALIRIAVERAAADRRDRTAREDGPSSRANRVVGEDAARDHWGGVVEA